MKNPRVYLVVRILFGLWMLVSSIGIFFPFAEQPELAPAVMEFSTALFKTGYMLPAVGIVFVAVGFALLMNRYVPLAMIILAPITVNIILLHLFLDPSSILLALILLVLHLYVVWVHFDSYRPMLKAR